MKENKVCYFVGTLEENIHLCEDGTLEWSRHIIDADIFYSEKEAQDVADYVNKNYTWADGIFVGVSMRSGPPQPFLYTNPYLPPREQRVRKHGEPYWLERTLEKIRNGEDVPKSDLVKAVAPAHRQVLELLSPCDQDPQSS